MKHLAHSLLALAALFGMAGLAQAQNYYVFYNTTYGYLYNEGGTLKSSAALRFDKSSLWSASGNLGTTNRTIQPYGSSTLYLRTSNNNGGTVSLSSNSTNWQMRDNSLCVRTGGSGATNYFLKATGATTFTTASGDNGNRYTPYAVTVTDIAAGLGDFEVTGDNGRINATGTYTYSHTNARYTEQPYVNYYFNSINHYVNASNATTTSDPSTAVASGYTWSLSANAEGYATVDASTGAVTVTQIPDVGNITITITLTCTLTYNGYTATATKDIKLTQTGISGTTVTLDDREDHNWSYYSDANCPIRSLGPADVKITYYGNGTNTVSTSNDATPALNTFTASTNNSVKVGIDAPEGTFVYYKTLERTDGAMAATAAAASGRCAYTTIPNPFSVRPTYGTNSTSKWRGFYAWRVKSVSGGTIYTAANGGSAIAAGGTINAETAVYFAPTSEYGMEVELEALWARAYVSTSGVGSYSVGVERNFFVIPSSTSYTVTAGAYPCTYTSIYPNGTTNGTTLATIDDRGVRRSAFTARADSKIEYIILYNHSDNTINGAGYNLTIGRGVTPYGTYCAAIIQGASSASSDIKYSIRVESGIYENLYVAAPSSSEFSGLTSLKCILGCDYDRAQDDNSQLSIAPTGSSNHKTGTQASGGEIYGGNTMRFTSSANKDNLTFDWDVKSGKFLNAVGAADGGTQSIYLGSSQSSTQSNALRYAGKRRIIVEGGEIAGIAGGMNSQNASGTADNYDNNFTTKTADDVVVIRIKGGIIRGSVYGAAAFAGASGGRKFIFTGGSIGGWVAGGANGTKYTRGALFGASNIYIGGNTQINSNSSTTVINSTVGGNVFGAGCGFSNGSSSGQVTLGTTVVVADDAFIERGVYGGGAFGYTTSTSHIHILGGHIGGVSGGVTVGSVSGTDENATRSNVNYSSAIAGGVFGGACQNRGGTVNIYMNGGLVEGGVYGGSNASGTVTGPVKVNIYGGTVGTAAITDPDASETGHVFGSGYGEGTSVTGNVEVVIGAPTGTDVHSDYPLIYGNVYGGGHNAPYTSSGKTFTVVGQNGKVMGSVFGGGKGATAVITGNTDVTLKGSIEVMRNVFGGGHRGTVKGSTSVKIQ